MISIGTVQDLSLSELRQSPSRLRIPRRSNFRHMSHIIASSTITNCMTGHKPSLNHIDTSLRHALPTVPNIPAKRMPLQHINTIAASKSHLCRYNFQCTRVALRSGCGLPFSPDPSFPLRGCGEGVGCLEPMPIRISITPYRAP
jgi:hypothetical protein